MYQAKTIMYLEELLNQLRDDQLPGYGKTPIPGPKDYILMELIDALILVDSEARSALIKKIGGEYQFSFPGFAERLSSYAVRLNSSDILRRALLALSLTPGGDKREILLVCSLVAHSAKKLGVDLRAMLHEHSDFVDEPFKKAVTDFLARPPEDQSIVAMGYKEGSDSDGFRYVRNW